MQKLFKAAISIVLALMMVIPLATQASARQVPLPRPRQIGGNVPGQNVSIESVTMDGRNFSNALRFSVSSNRLVNGNAFTEHHLGGQHATLSGYIGWVGGLGNATITFYSVNERGSGQRIQSHTIRQFVNSVSPRIQSPQRIYVDVRGVETLRIRVTKASTDSVIPIPGTYVFANGQLCNDMEAAAQRFRSSPWGWIVAIGGLVIAIIGLLLALVFDQPGTGYVVALGGALLVILGSLRLLGIRML